MTDNLINILADFDFIDLTENEAQASSINLNPYVSWAKFIFTDDQPNGNNKRIPLEEFQNIIRTGVHMPIKMATGKIEPGHDKSVPLGTIAQLKIEGNKVLGLAALWLAERPEDVQLIKEKNKTDSKAQISWEVLYGSSSTEDSGAITLNDVCVRAATIVGMPAYKGRTPILDVASDTSNNTEENNVEMTLEQLTQKVSELEANLATSTATIAERDTQIATLTTELTTLKEFKASIDKKQAEEAKFASIKQKFIDSKIEKPVEYFETNREKLLALDESAIDFMLQELVAFSSSNTNNASLNPSLPNIQTVTSGITMKDLAEALKANGLPK